MCTSLVEASNHYIYTHFVEVSKCEEFLSLEKDELIEIISRDDLHVSSEEQVRHHPRDSYGANLSNEMGLYCILTYNQVFEACLSWVYQERVIRQEFMADLMAKVRLPLIAPQYLADRVATESLVKTSLPCRLSLYIFFH